MNVTFTVNKTQVKILEKWLRTIGNALQNSAEDKKLQIDFGVDDDGRLLGWKPSFSTSEPIAKPSGPDDAGWLKAKAAGPSYDGPPGLETR
jgi:hypothetical protein